jgi:hypothetical protein
MPISRIISLVLLTLLLSSIACADDKEETLNALLSSGSLSEQRTAFEKIASSPKQYVPLVRTLASSQIIAYIRAR